VPIPQKYLADLNENGIYHIYNRTNNREKLFLSDENRYFFLRKYNQYLSPVIDTYCWCLLPNHFHLLVRVKPAKLIQTNLQAIDLTELLLTEKRFLKNEITMSELIEQSFKRFFQSYSLSFNQFHNRKGNLFYRPFKRIEISKESHFTQAIVYIHANPVKHRLTKDFTAYKWSSWHSLLSSTPTKLLRTELMEWFGGRESFISTHKKMAKHYSETDISIED
jgi:putative transposase